MTQTSPLVSQVLTTSESDLLAELLHIGTGMAATELGNRMQDKVTLSVVNMQVCTCAEAVANLDQETSHPLISLRQQLNGDIQGTALLLFPESSDLELLGPADTRELARRAGEFLDHCLQGILAIFPGHTRCRNTDLSECTPQDLMHTGLAHLHDGSFVICARIRFDLPQQGRSGLVHVGLNISSIKSLQTHIQAWLKAA